jgi:hypothetical protein
MNRMRVLFAVFPLLLVVHAPLISLYPASLVSAAEKTEPLDLKALAERCYKLELISTKA